MDKFYAQHLQLQHECISGIQRQAPILLEAFITLGNDLRQFGYDIGNANHQVGFSELMDPILSDLYLSKEMSEPVKTIVDELISSPKNLIGLVPYLYSEDLYVAVEELTKQYDFQTKMEEMSSNGRLPFSAFLAAFNDVIGFNGKGMLFTKTKNALVPVENIINNLKEALTKTGDKVFSPVARILFRVGSHNMGSSNPYVSKLSTASVLFTYDCIFELDIRNNPKHKTSFDTLKRQFEEAEKQKNNLEIYKNSKEYTLKGYNKRKQTFKNTQKNIFSAQEKFLNNQDVVKFTTRTRSAVSQKFDVVGRWDGIVSFLNLINVYCQLEALQSMPGNASKEDIADHQLTIAYSSAWFINAVAGTIRSLTLNKVLSKKAVKSESFSALRSGSSTATHADIKLGQRYLTSSLIAGISGVIAIGLEGWQTFQQLSKSTDSVEKKLLVMKGTGLALQGLNWGPLIYRTLGARFLSSAIGEVLLGWMLAFSFWGAALYLVATILLVLNEKTPLEAWLADCVWGIDPDFSLSAEQEFHNLIAILYAPKIETTLLEKTFKRVSPLREVNGFYHQLIITLSNPRPNEKIWLGVGIKSSQAFSKTYWLTQEELNKPLDEKQKTILQKKAEGKTLNIDKHLSWEGYSADGNQIFLRVILPKPLTIIAERSASTVIHDQLNVYIKREHSNPYNITVSNPLSITYQVQTLATGLKDKSQQQMKEEKPSNLPDIEFMILQVPENEEK